MDYFCERHIYDLHYCNAKTVDALKTFCVNINRTHADIYIIMAQKAVCLFSILRDQNLIAPHVLSATIISNDALEFSPVDCKGKRVVLIDDIIVSGSTIAVTADKLINTYGVSLDNLRIIGLALDTEYHTMRFTDADGRSIMTCGKAVPNAECIELSYDICQIFAQYGIPYDTDFPAYPELKLSFREMQRQTCGLLWDSFRISSRQHDDAGIEALVLFPSEAVKQALWKRIGCDLEKIAHFKIRIYARLLPEEHIICRCVPMVLFHEISFEDIDELFAAVSSDMPEEIIREWSIRSKLLFVQFYLAHLLMMEFACHLECPYVPEVSDMPVALHFGPQMVSLVKNALRNSDRDTAFFRPSQGKKEFKKCKTDTLGYGAHSKKSDDMPEPQNSLFDINDMLLGPFVDQHVRRELPTRRLMRNRHLHFQKDIKKIWELYFRLTRGYSLQVLTSILNAAKGIDCETERINQDAAKHDTDVKGNDADEKNRNGNTEEHHHTTERLTSLFLDRAIDSGMIVPIVYVDRKERTVCRAYRHGEDLPFGEADRCRLLYFLYYLDKELNDKGYGDGIAVRSFEKMIVLFYQVGLRGIDGQRSIFNRFLGFNNMLLLHERFSVHGTVIAPYRPTAEGTDPQPHPYYETSNGSQQDDAVDGYSQWLTHWLKQNKFIIEEKIDARKQHYTVNTDEILNWCARFKIDPKKEEMDLSNLSCDIKNDIQVIADLLVTWYDKSSSKDTFKDDITVLTSCYDQKTAASAIMTEIHYFKNYYNKQIIHGIEELCSGNCEEDSPFTWGTLATALHSGRQKYEWYKDKQGHEVIERTSRLLDSSDRYIWNRIWSSRRDDYRTTSLDGCMVEGMGYLRFYSACYEWLNGGGLTGTCNSDAEERIQKHREAYRAFSKEESELYMNGNHLLDDRLFDLFDDLTSVEFLPQRAKIFSDRVGRVLQASEALLVRVENELARSSDTYSVYYGSCLILEIDGLDRKQSDSVLMTLWNLQEENWDKTRLNIVRFENDEKQNLYGIFYQNNDQASVWDTENFPLYQVYRQLCGLLRGYACGFRMALIPELPAGKYFCHNTLTNMKQNAQTFAEDVLRNIVSFWSDSRRQLLILLRPENRIDWFSSLVGTPWENVPLEGNICCIPQASSDLAVYRYHIPEQTASREITIISKDPETQEKSVAGTGILYIQDGVVYALTCRHVLKDAAVVKGRMTSGLEFPLRYLDDEEDFACGNPNTAEQELAVLLPEWESYCQISLQDAFSEKNCTLEKIESGHSCRCFGYPDKRGSWIEDLRYSAPVGDGYDELHYSGKKAKKGFSGGPVISSEDCDRLIGLHAEHQNGSGNEGIAFIIPARTIVSKMKKIHPNM